MWTDGLLSAYNYFLFIICCDATLFLWIVDSLPGCVKRKNSHCKNDQISKTSSLVNLSLFSFPLCLILCCNSLFSFFLFSFFLVYLLMKIVSNYGLDTNIFFWLTTYNHVDVVTWLRVNVTLSHLFTCKCNARQHNIHIYKYSEN